MPFSPPQSVASSSGPSTPLTVKKLVIDGRSKGEGALCRMYLKLSVCIDNVQPGALLPLFPEHNSRLLSSEVHPLDDRFRPYYFSPDNHPLIEKAVNSLQLPPALPKLYSSLFNVNDPDTSRRHRGVDPARYSAQVLVSAYTVTLVLPKEFPPPKQSSVLDSEDDESSSRHSRSARKHTSAFSRNHLHYVVATELSIPFLTTPPRGPFLISIPVPRCLDNQLRMRIAIPLDSTTRMTRGAGDSTSSGDDLTGWDFLTDPPVTRRFDRTGARNGDEDHPSDHTSTTPGVEVIQGAFQSTEYLHVRWAPPLPRRSRPENGMWRVNMQTSNATMKCQVLARNESTLRMGISYEATCSELWHPGVATIVGLDVVLDAKRRAIFWPEEDHLKGWTVAARGEAFVGINKDLSQAVSRHSSLESGFSSTFLPTLNHDSMLVPPRGSASLLHAPLPSNNPNDFSFENSSPNGTPEKRTELLVTNAQMVKDALRTSKDSPPNTPITLRINMLKLLRSSRNEIFFTIRGVIMIKLDPEMPEDYISLPSFNVLGIHTQDVKTWVSLRIPNTKDIYVDEEHPSEHSRRLLTAGEEVRCEEDTVLIIPHSRSLGANSHSKRLSPNNVYMNESSSPSRRQSRTSRVSRNSPLSTRVHTQATQPSGHANSLVASVSSDSSNTMLAHVKVVITPLKIPLPGDRCPHCVEVTLPVCVLESDTVRFSLATSKSLDSESVSPNVALLYAVSSGRQIPAEIYKVADGDLELTASNTIPKGRSSSQVFGEMRYTISLGTGGTGNDSGSVVCVYLVDFPETEVHGKEKTSIDKIELDALLPCFHIPVLMYEVLIESAADSYEVKSTTLKQHSLMTFSQYHVPAGFYPSLRVSLLQNRTRRTWSLKVLHYILVYTFLVLFIFQFLGLRRDLLEMRTSVGSILYGLMNDGDAYSFTAGNYRTRNEPSMGQDDPNRDCRHLEPSMVIVSTVTTTLTVTQTPVTLASTTEGSIEDDLVRIIRLSEATHIQPPQPTLARSPSRFRENIQKEMKALIQLRPPSFSSYRLPFPDETRTVVKKLMKFMYFLRRVWNFPMDPD